MSDMDIVMGEGGSDPLEGIDEAAELIQPVALLMDELKSEDTAVRVESMRRLRTIALALGPERTRNELVPFLLTSLDEEDEVLAALADEVVGLIEHVGGDDHCHVLLPLLEGLVSAEEPYVRSKAVEAFQAILSSMPAARIPEHVLPIVQRLAGAEWFSRKSSSASLIVAVLARLGEHEMDSLDGAARQALVSELVKLFASLAADEAPLVRKAVANNLSTLAGIVDAPVRSTNLVPICVQLAADPQDSVRLLSIEPLAELFERAVEDGKQQEDTKTLMQLFLSLAGDNSWRIRFMVASHFGSLARSLQKCTGSEVIDTLEIYCALLRDAEAEVRTAASSQLSAVSQLFPDAAEDQIVASVRLLISDPSPHVRAELALQLNHLAKLLRDDSSEVRLNVISKLNVIVDVVGIDLLAVSLLPAIINLAEDKQWRVRQTIIEYIPELSLHLGQDFFNEKLSALTLGWMDDSVYEVRVTAIGSIKRIISQFGTDWAAKSLLPRLLEYRDHQNYLRRITLIMALSATCSVVSVSTITSMYLPALQKLSSDNIPNVRFNVAKALKCIAPVLLADGSAKDDDAPCASIVPILQQLRRDADPDVQDFAADALEIIPTF